MVHVANKGLVLLFLTLLIPKSLLGVRVISSSPQLTELMFQLGKGNDIVATSEGSSFPEQAKALPTIGTLFMPSIERTIFYKPDWVLLDSKNLSLHYERSLKTMKVRYQKVDISDVNTLLQNSEDILKTFYGESTNPILEAYKNCLSKLSSSHSFSYLALVWISPTIAFGQNTFLSKILSLVGGNNALPKKWESEYPKVSEEWLLLQNIDVVFYLNETPGTSIQLKKLSEKWWPQKKIPLQPLDPKIFARANFTPLKHLDSLSTVKPQKPYRECLEKSL